MALVGVDMSDCSQRKCKICYGPNKGKLYPCDEEELCDSISECFDSTSFQCVQRTPGNLIVVDMEKYLYTDPINCTNCVGGNWGQTGNTLFLPSGMTAFPERIIKYYRPGPGCFGQSTGPTVTLGSITGCDWNIRYLDHNNIRPPSDPYIDGQYGVVDSYWLIMTINSEATSFPGVYQVGQSLAWEFNRLAIGAVNCASGGTIVTRVAPSMGCGQSLIPTDVV